MDTFPDQSKRTEREIEIGTGKAEIKITGIEKGTDLIEGLPSAVRMLQDRGCHHTQARINFLQNQFKNLTCLTVRVALPVIGFFPRMYVSFS